MKAGELELIFLRSHPPESIQSGYPFSPFCILEIVPDLKSDVCGCCALANDATPTDVIVINTKANTIVSDSVI
ncbi:MAG: hypothetical protein WBZ36_07835 [Candidatus Nitrosopolaris sp.]